MAEVPQATKVSIGPRRTNLRASYLRRKRLAVIATAAWLYSLLPLGLANLFLLGLGSIVAIATSMTVLLAVAAVVSWNKEKARWASSTDCENVRGCGRAECDNPGEGCGERLKRDLDRKLLESELARLRSMLGVRFGPDLYFFGLWIVIAAGFLFRADSATRRVAAALLGIASVILIIARLALSSLAFGGRSRKLR